MRTRRGWPVKKSHRFMTMGVILLMRRDLIPMLRDMGLLDPKIPRLYKGALAVVKILLSLMSRPRCLKGEELSHTRIHPSSVNRVLAHFAFKPVLRLV